MLFDSEILEYVFRKVGFIGIFLLAIFLVIIIPAIGGLLVGIDRKLSAFLQSRRGPSILQPFYDIFKLFQKKGTETNPALRVLLVGSLLSTVATVVLFFMGENLLTCIFIFNLAAFFFVMAGYASYSPYSVAGSQRELLQILCYEPMMLIFAFSFYLFYFPSFSTTAFLTKKMPMILETPFIFLGFLVVLTVKLRKSPFDLSTSHHAHQELVKGITTEFSGKNLAIVELIHWYETVFALGLVSLFFVASSLFYIVLAVILTFLVYILEIIADNMFCRLTWEKTLKICWVTTIIFGVLHFGYLFLFLY